MTPPLVALAQDIPAADTFQELGTLTLADWLWAGGLTLAAIVAAMVTLRLTVRAASRTLAPLVARLLGRLAALVVFVIGFFYALQRVDVSLAPVLGLLGLAGIAFALAFQEVLENFVAGIFLSARRPFDQGDEITTGDHQGVVEDISLRELTLRTYDGELVFIPNSEVWRNAIVNHTALGMRRTTLVVGVGYDSSLLAVDEVLVDAVAQVDGVVDDPAPQAYAYEFGDSSINYAVRFWHEAPVATEWRVRNQVMARVHEALGDAGVEIPFPQRVVALAGASTLTET